jgi:hypothetical protein
MSYIDLKNLKSYYICQQGVSHYYIFIIIAEVSVIVVVTQITLYLKVYLGMVMERLQEHKRINRHDRFYFKIKERKLR